jgi:hypothetical protein
MLFIAIWCCFMHCFGAIVDQDLHIVLHFYSELFTVEIELCIVMVRATVS